MPRFRPPDLPIFPPLQMGPLVESDHKNRPIIHNFILIYAWNFANYTYYFYMWATSVYAMTAPSRTWRGPRLNSRRNLGQKCRLCRISLINLPCRLCRSEERLSSRNHRKIVHDNLWQCSGNPHPSYVRENHKKLLNSFSVNEVAYF